MKIKRIIKDVIFAICAVLVLVFNEKIMHHDLVNYVVGASMIIFAIDELITQILEKKLFTHHTHLPGIAVLIILAILMIVLGKDNIQLTCILWATWAITREAEEIGHKVVHQFKETPIMAIFNLIESLVLIYLSITLMIEPGEHHAHIHIIALGIELLLEIIWPLLSMLEEKIRNKKVKE